MPFSHDPTSSGLTGRSERSQLIRKKRAACGQNQPLREAQHCLEGRCSHTCPAAGKRVCRGAAHPSHSVSDVRRCAVTPLTASVTSAGVPHACLTAAVMRSWEAQLPHSTHDGFPLRKGRNRCSQSTKSKASTLLPVDTAEEGVRSLRVTQQCTHQQFRGGGSAPHTLHSTSQPEVHIANPLVLVQREATVHIVLLFVQFYLRLMNLHTCFQATQGVGLGHESLPCTESTILHPQGRKVSTAPALLGRGRIPVEQVSLCSSVAGTVDTDRCTSHHE